MKLSTRPISSPGRVEKFPPPLMRFLRTNASTHRRGSRSRASPIFIKQRTMGTAPIVAKEPSSPKVTCMGQVRARRSKQAQRRPGRRRCRWIPRIQFCRGLKCGVRVRFSLFQGSNCCTLGWPKWVSFFRSGPRRGGEEFRDDMEDAVIEDDDDGELEGEGNRFGSSPCSPPKNALILTRCRSAPYTSSSLACRFWGSPLEPEKIEQVNGRLTEDGGENREMDISHVLTNSEGTCGSIGDDDEMATKSENGEGMEMREGDMEAEVVRPLMLTRCKSEPARTGEKLMDPEVVGGYWRKTRLGVVDSCSPRAL